MGDRQVGAARRTSAEKRPAKVRRHQPSGLEAAVADEESSAGGEAGAAASSSLAMGSPRNVPVSASSSDGGSAMALKLLATPRSRAGRGSGEQVPSAAMPRCHYSG